MSVAIPQVVHKTMLLIYSLERFSIECRTNCKVITPINHSRCKQHDEPIKFVAISSNLLKARKKISHLRVAIGFGFPSRSVLKWREIVMPITKRSNRNRLMTFDSHLKTALKLKPR